MGSLVSTPVLATSIAFCALQHQSIVAKEIFTEVSTIWDFEKAIHFEMTNLYGWSDGMKNHIHKLYEIINCGFWCRTYKKYK
jgi:hypothetical protein